MFGVYQILSLIIENLYLSSGMPAPRPPMSFAPPPGHGLPPAVVHAPSLREPGPMLINMVKHFFCHP